MTIKCRSSGVRSVKMRRSRRRQSSFGLFACANHNHADRFWKWQLQLQWQNEYGSAVPKFVMYPLVAFTVQWFTAIDAMAASSSSAVLGASSAGPSFTSERVLGTCDGYGEYKCFSSLDDRPPYFIAPWTFESESDLKRLKSTGLLHQSVSINVSSKTNDSNDELSSLRNALSTEGFSDITVERGKIGDGEADGIYVSARTLEKSSDECVVEFYLQTKGDNIAQVRLFVDDSNDYTKNTGDIIPAIFKHHDQLLNRIRLRLGWEEVVVLRNRTRLFGLFESPFDSFGPTPPVGESLAEIDPDDTLAFNGSRSYLTTRD